MSVATKVPQSVLLTGASGVVGQALLPQLLEEKYSVTCLVNKREVEDERVESVKGNVREKQLGIPTEMYRKLTTETEQIIHSAAITNFDSPRDAIMETNVNGTKNIVELAVKSNAKLIYVSTAFVHRTELPASVSEYSAYCDSKREAESIVRESGIDYKIVRPSIVVGDSTSGQIAAFQGMHIILGAILNRFAPVIPVSPESYVDMIPQDILVNVITSLLKHQTKTKELWVTYGSSAPNASSIIKVLEEFSQLCNCLKAMPRMVSPDMVERLIKPVFLPSFPGYMRKRMEMLINYACYFNLFKPFPSNYESYREDLKLPNLPEVNEILWNNLEFWSSSTRYREKHA